MYIANREVFCIEEKPCSLEAAALRTSLRYYGHTLDPVKNIPQILWAYIRSSAAYMRGEHTTYTFYILVFF